MVKGQRIVFFHPDLGIGGAERLVVDAAVGLQDLGHKVTIFTSHCDPSHCFEEARNGTLDVRVRGNSIFPATIFGRFKILLAVLRQLHLLAIIYLNGEARDLRPVAFFVDQLSAGIPLMRLLFRQVHVLFYCHFPDLLLVQSRQNVVKRIWRLPFDWLEGWSMNGADRIVVNSNFTKTVVEEVWPGLSQDRDIGVIYPCVSTKDANSEKLRAKIEKKIWPDKNIVLSINRFERKKDVSLAVLAYAALPVDLRKHSRLVISGGYDSRVRENVEYHHELIELAERSMLKTATAKNIITASAISSDVDVVFLLSIPAQLKTLLLYSARLLVYTPAFEHFGIVPLEAMLAGLPVLASNTGGPLETIVEGKTGWLRDTRVAQQWADVMHKALVELSDDELRGMGENGSARVKAEFSEAKMAQTLNGEIREMTDRPRAPSSYGSVMLFTLAAGFVALWAILFALARKRA